MKLEFKDFPWWLNPELSHKEIKECYDREIKKIDDMAAWRKSPYKIPGYPGAYNCVSIESNIKYQRGYCE